MGNNNSTTKIIDELESVQRKVAELNKRYRAALNYNDNYNGNYTDDTNRIRGVLDRLMELVYQDNSPANYSNQQRQAIKQQLEAANQLITSFENKAGVTNTTAATAAAATDTNEARSNNQHGGIRRKQRQASAGGGIRRRRQRSTAQHKNIGAERTVNNKATGTKLKRVTTTTIDDLKKDLETARSRGFKRR